MEPIQGNHILLRIYSRLSVMKEIIFYVMVFEYLKKELAVMVALVPELIIYSQKKHIHIVYDGMARG